MPPALHLVTVMIPKGAVRTKRRRQAFFLRVVQEAAPDALWAQLRAQVRKKLAQTLGQLQPILAVLAQ